MPIYTFDDLRTQEAAADIRQQIVDRLVADGVPVASWPPSSTGGVENLRLDMVANGMQALSAARIAQAVTGRVLPTAVAAAAAETAPGPATMLLKKLGRDFYRLPWRGATSTIQNMRFSTIGKPSSYTFQPLELTVRADATGNLYTNVEGGTLQPGGKLDLPCEAAAPGAAYDDPAGTVTTMITARAGVICTNVAPADFTAARSDLGSSGTMVAAFAVPGTAPAFSALRVQFLAGGDIGGAIFQYSTDGGLTWAYGGVVSPSMTIAGGAVALTFTNGVAPSFIAGDVLTTFVGSALLQRGADAETPAAFGQRCTYRWRSLSDVPTVDKVALWAHQASDEVDRVWSDADPNTPGSILVTIASSSGPASPQAQIDVEDFISARLNANRDVVVPVDMGPVLEIARVTSAIPHFLWMSGWAYVPRRKMAATQKAAAVAWDAYLRNVPVGGMRGAVVRAAKLEEILTDVGADRTELVTLIDTDGTLQDDIAMDHGEVAQMAAGKTLLNSIGWVAI